ncbi:MAG: hypothetical protein GTO24_25310 [candidate division Zixibacteria bacterium]|nr:hypothetical protein [candidate division Zixibacteria bacterium]
MKALGSLGNRAILRRLERLETVFAVSPVDDWIDIVLWSGSDCGVFGHTRYRFSKSRGESEWIPCSDEEEIQIMREGYERDGHRLYGRGSEVSFAEYLERFSYLGPKERGDERKRIIERLKGERDGA